MFFFCRLSAISSTFLTLQNLIRGGYASRTRIW
ncbi:hypothetical protein Golax_011570 [Gossypium laxum]|uniref:Uncharacterized protein n=1 Tax=Gossypium laxum TaxID=34288 RepID=A0A7J8ZKY4_9ROSI|nr:hypothetical protein [Gossypium laxum]